PDAVIKVWGEGVTPPLRERLLANDSAALIACLQGSRLNAMRFSEVARTIGVPPFIYAGSADALHNAARQTASEIDGAQFVAFPGLVHPAALWRRDLVLPHVEPFLAKSIGH